MDVSTTTPLLVECFPARAERELENPMQKRCSSGLLICQFKEFRMPIDANGSRDQRWFRKARRCIP